MTITYHAGRRIQGLSTDVANTITYSDDFSGTDDWADQGSGVGVNTTTDRLEFNSWTDNTTNNSSTLDLGSALSDTAWVIRFKLQWTGFSNTTDWTAPAIGMFSADSSTGGNSAQDMLFYWSIANGSEKRVYLSSADNSTISGTDTNLNLSWQLNTTYYVELVRDGSNFSATVWTGSYNGTEVASGTDTIGGTVSGLQYFGVKSPVSNRGGSFTGWLDDLKIWDGITSLTSKPTNVQSGSRFEETDTRKIYYRALPSITDSTLNSTDGTTGWDMTNAGSSISLDTTNNEVDFLLPTGTKSCSYDLGANVSQSWVLRFATTWSGAGSNNPIYWIGLSNQATTISNSTLVTGAFLMFYGGSSYKISVPVNSRMDQVGANQVNLSPTTTCNATPYWGEIIKNGSTSITVSIYPNSSYATPTATYTLNVDISSYNLRYLTGVTYNQGSGTTGTFSDVKFYNGVTSTTDITWAEEV